MTIVAPTNGSVEKVTYGNCCLPFCMENHLSKTLFFYLAPKKRSGLNLKNPDLDFLKKKKKKKKKAPLRLN